MGHSPWWVWGLEQGVNQCAVAIGNHTVFSNEALEEQDGLIGMDLVRLGLERGRTAAEALLKKGARSEREFAARWWAHPKLERALFAAALG